MNIVTVLMHLGYSPNIDFVADADGAGAISITWLIANPPTQAAIDAAAKPAYAALKTEEIYREQEIRSKTVWGKEVDRYFFAWVEELYGKILKTSARNNIYAVETPITYGLKALRDNRNTLLAGLNNWVNDPLKTAENIAAFDVAGWAGWSVARPE